VTHHQCTAALLRAKITPQSAAHGKKHSPLLTAAQQNTLAEALCHCQNTYEDSLSVQVCSDPLPHSRG